jgi:adenylyltransferase/sulfurtransferase
MLAKHDRSIPILGKEGHERLENSVVVVAGLGAIGSVFFEIMVRQGIGIVIAIDPDQTVENHNLDRQFLYREIDLGKQKATAAMETAKEINKEVDVVSYVGTFSQAINSSLRETIS